MRTLVLIFDSLRNDAALQCGELLGLRDWKQLGVSLATAPYTPSSMTTIATGVHPVNHRFWDFPPRLGSNQLPSGDEYIFFNAPVPTVWVSSYPGATYMWPGSMAVRNRANAVKWLRDKSDGIMFVHLWESHAPYSYPHDIDTCITEMQELETISERLEYVNHGLRAAIAWAQPLLDVLTPDDYVIATGDHGEALGETNPATGNPEWLHQHVTPQEIVTPFWVSGPNQICEAAITHLDIRDTVVESIYHGERLDADKFDLPRSGSWAIARWRYPGAKIWTEHGLVYQLDGEWISAVEYEDTDSERVLVGDQDALSLLTHLNACHGRPVFI